MELQLIRVEWSEQASGSRSFVSGENIHSAEGFVLLEGHVSTTERFPFSWKWKCSKRESGEGDTEAFTEE